MGFYPSTSIESDKEVGRQINVPRSDLGTWEFKRNTERFLFFLFLISTTGTPCPIIVLMSTLKCRAFLSSVTRRLQSGSPSSQTGSYDSVRPCPTVLRKCFSRRLRSSWRKVHRHRSRGRHGGMRNPSYEEPSKHTSLKFSLGTSFLIFPYFTFVCTGIQLVLTSLEEVPSTSLFIDNLLLSFTITVEMGMKKSGLSDLIGIKRKGIWYVGQPTSKSYIGPRSAEWWCDKLITVVGVAKRDLRRSPEDRPEGRG